MLLEAINTVPLYVYVLFVIPLFVWMATRRPPGIPPGPPLIPLLGNVLALDSDPQVTFRKLRQQYGDIFSIYIFNKPVIVLNGYKTLRDALVKNAGDFSDRPSSFLSDHISKGLGIVFSSGQLWQEHRAFALKTLKELGMGKSKTEETILAELSFLLQCIQKRSDFEFDCGPLFHTAVCNVISYIEFGQRFDYDDPLFLELLEMLHENVVNLQSANVLNVLPAVRFIPGDPFKFVKTLQNLRTIEEKVITPIVTARLRDGSPDRSDFTSSYIAEMKRRQQLGIKTTLGVDSLKISLLDLFVAGSETTGTALNWAMTYFLNYPEVQEKCFQEVKATIGLERPPSMKDKTSLPYLEATINEILRCADAVPASLPHTVDRQIQYRGYTFPKGVTILPLLSSVLQDPDVWGDPENFRPERFLNSEGKFVRKEELIPFSIGRRECLGESLSRMELFLFIGGMIQKYQFFPGEEGPPSLKSCPGIVSRPTDFRVKVAPRMTCGDIW